MKKLAFLILFISLGILFLSFNKPVLASSPQAVFYISSSGDNNNTGSLEKPFKTLEKARDVIRTINKNMTGDIIVYLRGGTYTLTSPLTLDQTDSGTNDFNIIYQNYQQEAPVISGGKQIIGWQQDGNKWKAHVGTGINSRQLYINGVRAIRVRSTGGLPGAVKTTTGYTTTDTSMQNWQNQSDIEFVANLAWKQFRCPIQSISGNTITMQQPCWTNANLHKDITTGWDLTMPAPSWIENAFELLDQPGEWYLNRQTGDLYYLPRTGENMTTATVILPTLETLISGNEVHNIEFKNLTFSYATWLRPGTAEGFAEMQGNLTITGTSYTSNADIYKLPVGNWTKPQANISFSHANSIVFDQDSFSHLGGAGLNLDLGTKNSIVSGCEFTDISSSGIIIGNVDNPKTTDGREITSGVEIHDNAIHNTAVEFQGGEGIWTGYAQNTNIHNNILFDLPYTALSMGWGWGYNDSTFARDNKIQQNIIYDFNKALFDGGGIYSLSAQPGNVYSGNFLYYRENKTIGWDYPIYLDERSRYIEIANNVIFRTVSNYATFISGGNNNVHDNWWNGNDSSHDGTNVDPNGRGTCLPTPCGANTVTNNHLISAVSQAPSAIITAAGPAPQRISPIGIIQPGTQNVTWNNVPGASGYLLRIDNLSDPWNCSGVNPGGDVCTDVLTTNNFSYNFQKDHDYRIWVHAVFSITGTYGPAGIVNVSSRNLTYLPGDLDHNGKIDIFDYNLLIQNFGKTDCGNVADIDGNCRVDIFDYNILVENFGK